MLISVIIPVYNVELYLKKCVDSVSSQDCSCFEIILVDDGSTDSSDIICDELAGGDSRIRVIHQQNKGLGGARNTGITAAEGDYLLFLDSDDYLRDGSIEKLARYVEEHNDDIVLYDMDYVNEKGEVIKTETAKPHNSEEVKFEENSAILVWPCAWNKLCRRTLFTENGITFPERIWFEDLATMPVLLALAGSIGYIHEPFYCYLQRDDSIMALAKTNPDRIKRNEEIITALDRITGLFGSFELERTFSEELSFLVVYHALLSAVLRIGEADCRNPLQYKITDYALGRCPAPQKNRYYPILLGRRDRISLFFIRKKQYALLHFILRLSRKLKSLLK